MADRERFVLLAQTGRFTVTDLCTDFGYSRKTVRKHLRRYQADGKAGLVEHSRRPNASCNFLC